MAHKKGQSSSRNNRESNAQRLGVKRFGGERVRYVRAMRSRVVLVPVLTVLIAALVALSIAYRYSDRYYRNLALKEFIETHSRNASMEKE